MTEIVAEVIIRVISFVKNRPLDLKSTLGYNSYPCLKPSLDKRCNKPGLGLKGLGLKVRLA